MIKEGENIKTKLIVGLGNPGKEYEDTRHNMGFHYIDNYATKKGISIDKEKNNGKYNVYYENGNTVILLKPQLYMNLSGIVIKKYIDFYKIELKDVLILHDDMDIEIGKFKLKATGSSAGHNGLKSIEENLKTEKYQRIKLGISRNKDISMVDYVIGKMSNEEIKKRDELNTHISNIIDDFGVLTFDQMMMKYNRK